MWEKKMAPLAGLAAFGLVALSAALVNKYDFMPPADEVAAFYEGSSLRIMVGAYAGVLAAFFFLWFAGSVRNTISNKGEGRLGALALAGGVMAATMMAAGYLAHTAGAERARIQGTIDPGSGAALYDISSLAVGTGAAIGFAVLLGSVALARIDRHGYPRWLTVVSGITALGLISPVNYLFLAVAVLWVPVVGVVIYRRERAAIEAAVDIEV
jgi:hypothetical protein